MCNRYTAGDSTDLLDMRRPSAVMCLTSISCVWDHSMQHSMNSYLAVDRLDSRQTCLQHVGFHFGCVPLADDFLLHAAVRLDCFGAAVLRHHALDLLSIKHGLVELGLIEIITKMLSSQG